MADALLIALGGGLLGIVAAPSVSSALLSFFPDNVAGRQLSSSVDLRVLAFAFLMTAMTAVLCGVAPAFHASRASLIASLKERATIAVPGGVRLRKALVTAQIGFTLILLVGAGLFLQTLMQLRKKGPGFATSSLVAFQVKPDRNGYSAAGANRLLRRMYAELQSVPQVESAALATIEMLMGGSWNMFLTVDDGNRFVTGGLVLCNTVTPGYFATLGTSIVAGRDFDNRDSRPIEEAGSRSVIVNESFVRRYFGGRNPIGHRLGFGNRPDTAADVRIIGVVGDFSYTGIRGQTEQAYVPFLESNAAAGTFYLKVHGRPESAFPAIRAAVRNIAPSVPIEHLRTLDEQVARSLTSERMLAPVSSGFGIAAILLSVVGLYGVMSFVVTQRTREIGIRLALGASRTSAVWMVLREAVAMIAAGTAIALPCVWALSRLVQSQLFGVSAFDAPTVLIAALILAVVAFVSTLLPARRAASVSPTTALRFD